MKAVDALQERVATEINARLLGETLEVLVEGRDKGKWRGRTRTDKLVFFEDAGDFHGKLARVRVTRDIAVVAAGRAGGGIGGRKTWPLN